MGQARPSGVPEGGATGPGTGAGRLTVDVLGPVIVRCRGELVPVGPAMIRNLLALLAVYPSGTVSREEIVAVLWDGDPPATYVNLIQVYVSRLRAQLRGEGTTDTGPVVSGNRSGYRLEVDPEAVDLIRFERMFVEAGRLAADGDVAGAMRTYEMALGCWRGPALADVDPRLGQVPAVVTANQHRIAAAVGYARLCTSAGRYQPAIDMLHSVAGAAPLHESLYAALMLAQAGAGDRASALDTYQTIRQRLADQLGVDPGAELQAIYLQLLREGEPDDTPPAIVPAADADRPSVPAAPVPEAAASPAAVHVDRVALPHRPRRLHRWRGRIAVLAGAVMVLAVVGGAAWVGRTPSRSAAPRDAAADAPVFRTAEHWTWAYDTSMGTTATGDQWASAYVSGLTDDESCAGFRLRVGTGPRGKGDNQGLLLAVCHTHWEIEAADADAAKVDLSMASAGQLRVAISSTNVVTITFNGSVVTTRQMRGSTYPGRHIVPAMYEGNVHVTMARLRSNAPPPSPPPSPSPMRR